MASDHGDPVGFRPQVLREYALVADGERGGLIGPHGDLVWMCAPRWDSDAVFSPLIGGSGAYAVTPADPWHVWGGYYEPGTMIWRSRWVTTESIIECRDALRYPGDPHRIVMVRRIIAVQHEARVRVLLDLHADYGREPLKEVTRHDGVWTARTGSLHVRWAGAADAQPRGASATRGA